MPTVLLLDSVSPALSEKLQQGGIDVKDMAKSTSDEVAAALPTADGLVVRSRTQVDAAMITSALRLRVIGRAGAGTDNIDKIAAAERDIAVKNVAGGNEAAVAELVVGFLFSLARKIPLGSAAAARGEWAKSKLMGFEIAGQTLGIVGLGRIGKQLAHRGNALGMKVLGYDPFLSDEVTIPGVERVSFESVLENSRFVSVHIPLSPETRGLLDSAALARMSPGAYVINCSRGGIVDETALAEALEAGTLAGAGLDVFENEPSLPSRLVENPAVVAMPHVGGSTKEAQAKIAELLGESLVDFFQDR